MIKIVTMCCALAGAPGLSCQDYQVPKVSVMCAMVRKASATTRGLTCALYRDSGKRSQYNCAKVKG